MIETAHALTSASPSRLHRDRTWAGDLGISSIEVWPAAGGGLLVGMIVRALSGATPLRQTVKNLFLSINTQGLSTVTVPYIRLEPEVLRCAADVITAELRISFGQVVVDNRIADSRSEASYIADLCPACELGLALLAAVARTLLTTAAAELWNVAVSECVVESGLVLGGSAWRLASYADLASDAALLALPDVVFLTSGRRVALGNIPVTSPSDRSASASPTIQRAKVRERGT